MTTVHPPSAPPISGAVSGEVPRELRTGERLRRLEQRRRLLREQFLAVLVLFIALAVTVAVLATQWLESGTSTAGAAPAQAGVVVPGSLFVELHSGGFALTHAAGVLP
ncbi:MAG TPA: hypothetical protein VFV02_03045 [Acidimicrobiales bacterium]|nr:hypothetical protein [Acidimicrobiales bacterium]